MQSSSERIGNPVGVRLSQLLGPPEYSDLELATRIRYAWHGLSVACRHHAYELSAIAAELAGVITRMVMTKTVTTSLDDAATYTVASTADGLGLMVVGVLVDDYCRSVVVKQFRHAATRYCH